MTCYQIKSGLSIDVWLSYLYVWVVEYCEIYVGDDYGFGKLVLLSGHVKRVSARDGEANGKNVKIFRLA